ncbi:hypothetical protein OT109_01340 [Phycisphaeraceae bacterium D3-23]
MSSDRRNTPLIYFLGIGIAASIFLLLWAGWAASSWLNESNETAASLQDQHWLDEIVRLKNLDAQSEAQHAVGRGDFRLWELHGAGMPYSPGFDWQSTRYNADALYAMCGTRIMEGVSDAIESDSHRRYIVFARAYAASYNLVLIDELDRLGRLP